MWKSTCSMWRDWLRRIRRWERSGPMSFGAAREPLAVKAASGEGTLDGCALAVGYWRGDRDCASSAVVAWADGEFRGWVSHGHKLSPACFSGLIASRSVLHTITEGNTIETDADHLFEAA